MDRRLKNKGRPKRKENKVRISALILPKTAQSIKSLKNNLKLSIGQVIDAAIEGVTK